MMRKYLMLLAALGMSGCATYSEIQQRQPTFEATTTKTPEAFAECVLPQWMDMNASTHIVATGDARTVVVPIGGANTASVMMTIEASLQNGKTHVEMRHMTSTSNFTKQWNEARSCL